MKVNFQIETKTETEIISEAEMKVKIETESKQKLYHKLNVNKLIAIGNLSSDWN